MADEVTAMVAEDAVIDVATAVIKNQRLEILTLRAKVAELESQLEAVRKALFKA